MHEEFSGVGQVGEKWDETTIRVKVPNFALLRVALVTVDRLYAIEVTCRIFTKLFN